jgi:hypothetical protein
MGAAALGGLLLLAGRAGATEDETREFPVTTEPPGALVSSITGNLGTTPLRIDERAIYPNQFPKDRIDLYGKLVLSRPGCATVTHQVTLAEVGSGIAVKLDCWDRSVPLRTEVLGPAEANEATASIQPATGAPPEPTAEGVAERRLRQLRVLDELLGEGLLSPEEERSIRQRILAQ